MNSDVTVRDKIQDVPMESNMAALANPGGIESNDCLFMKLAVETRLEIYSYLLVAAPSRAPSKEKASRGVVLAIQITSRKNQESISAIKRDRNGACEEIDLAPQILRTCKTIHREATAILYGENVFDFMVRDLHSHDIDYEGWGTLEAFCQTLFQHPTVHWGDQVVCHLFASFLLQIGQQNTASLKRLRFCKDEHKSCSRPDIQNAEWSIRTITQLLKCHVPGLRQVKICHGFGSWDEFENGLFAPSYDNNRTCGTNVCSKNVGWLVARLYSDIRREKEEAMHEAVADMVQEITWLKQLSFAGFVRNDPAYGKMEEVQALVKARR